MAKIKLWLESLSFICTYETNSKTITIEEETYSIMVVSWDIQTGNLVVLVNNTIFRFQLLSKDANCFTWYCFTSKKSVSIAIKKPVPALLSSITNTSSTVASPINGIVIAVLAKEGQVVTKGTPLLVVESMKMENEIRAPHNAVIQTIQIRKGDVVQKGDIVITLGPALHEHEQIYQNE